MRDTTTATPARLCRILPIAACLLLASGCSSNRQESSGLFSPYRIDLPQGNYVTREMLDQVQPGMTRDQVRAAIGSPLLNPVFRADRWDYVFRYQLPSGRAEQRRVTVRFKDDRVAAIEADELPLREDPDDPALPGSRARNKTPQAAVPPPAKESKEASR